MAKYIIAHDVGTSNSKAVLVDVEGKVHGRVVSPYDIKYPKPGWAEQDPEDWWKAMTTSTKQLIAETGVSPSDILCVVNASQLIGIVPMDDAGVALRPGIIWLDSRAPEEARWVMNKFLGPTVFTAIAGASITGKDGIPKLLWLKKNEPDVYKRMKYFLDVSGYLNYRCTGEMLMTWSNASAFGLDLKKKTWLEAIFKYVGFDTKKLAPLCRSTDKIGELTKEAAELMGLLPGTPVMGGTGDIQSAAVGSGAMGEGDGHISMGTSAWVGVVTRKTPTGKSGVVSTQSADPGKTLLLGQMELAGGCLRWLGDEMCRLEKADPSMSNIFGFMDSKVEQVPAGSDYLIFMPWMYGERAPVADAFIRSGFVNLVPEHTREHMIKAVYEGVAYNLRWIIEVIEKQFKFPLPSLRVIGGGALGHPWMQILADVTGKRIEPVRNPQEAGAVGAAMTAAVGLGIYKDFESLKDIVSSDIVFEPRDANREIYDFLYMRYKELYTDLKDFYTRINKDRCEEV
ncbi:MAG: FGGY-family carbohydrate kinase [Dehalococcoidia bacterium]|nr:FGGY-family carbohydrate kinase [Dehalococcoidia bacterium]MDD5648004.1 FGGY-family carbohydrate kinase [Dehalococcoidia bacterium]